MMKDMPGQGGGCRFCAKNGPLLDYKNINLLQKYSTPQGKILDRKRTGTCAKHQRRLANAIKRARFLALMRYSG